MPYCLIFAHSEVCDLSCSELLERLERLKRGGPSSDLVEYLYTFADVFLFFYCYYFFYVKICIYFIILRFLPIQFLLKNLNVQEI
jgi:hypothetical protein